MDAKYKLQNILKSYWFWIIGFFVFVWVIIRSGTNPKRLNYPCQQAAFPLASAWFIALCGLLTSTFLLRKVFKMSIPVIAILLSTWLFKASSPANAPNADYPTWVSANAISTIFLYDKVPATSGSLNAGNASVPNSYLSDPAIDSLVAIMSAGGLNFYKTSTQVNGIVGADDVVVIKVNFQWRNRMSTNTDRIKGVIWQILNHPDGFSGEILVCDNGSSQVQNTSYFCGFTEYANNSDDLNQDILDVVNVFKAKTYPVDYFVWDNLNNSIVAEYNTGNLADGYIYDAITKVNYPKFQTPKGNYVSLKNGVWSTQNNTFDKNKLCIINMPVLKAHGIAGATAAVKNWIGVMNQTKSSSWYGGDVDATFHPNYCFNAYALPAKVMNEIWPKLNIIDATWTAPGNNYDFNQTSIKTNTVLASTDPIALDWYATKYILTPVANNPANTNPDITNNNYNGKILNHWYNYFINSTSRSITKDSAKISVYGRSSLVSTHVEETSLNSDSRNAIHIFPNPSANGIFHVQNKLKYSYKTVSITNSTGILIKQIHFNSANAENIVDLSSLPDGLYLMQFTGISLKETIKIIKGSK